MHPCSCSVFVYIMPKKSQIKSQKSPALFFRGPDCGSQHSFYMV